MRRVLISVAGFYPAQKYGGPAVSIKNFCDLLCDTTELYIITSNHDMGTSEILDGIHDGWNDYQSCKVQYLAENDICEKKLKAIVEEIEPSHIYVNSLFDYRFAVPLVKIAAKNNISLILAPRGEICANAFNGKYKKLPYIWYLKYYLRHDNFYFQSTADDETQQLLKYIKNDKNHIFMLPNIPSIVPINPHERIKPDYVSCVFLARIQRKKNLVGALNVLRKVRIPVHFDIYGPKEVSDYWEKCQAIINQLPSNIIVEYKGAVEHTDVMKILASYDLYFFPTFSENYGHSIIESLQAGTPVLISDQTPWKDLEQYNAGWAFPLEDEQPFVNAIEEIYHLSGDEYYLKSEKAQRYVVGKLNIEEIKKQYEKMLILSKR